MNKVLLNGLFFAAIGVYLIISGATAKYLIDESEGLASQEQREAAKATPLKRVLVVSAGAAALVFGVVHIIHSF